MSALVVSDGASVSLENLEHGGFVLVVKVPGQLRPYRLAMSEINARTFFGRAYEVAGGTSRYCCVECAEAGGCKEPDCVSGWRPE